MASRRFCIALALVGLLSSCSFLPETKKNEYLPGVRLEPRGEVNLTYHDFTFQREGNSFDSLPAIGDQKALVIPVEFSDYPFSKKTLEDIGKAFNGGGEYWESVASFYEKSSYGQLHLSFTVAEPFKVGQSVTEFFSKPAEHQHRYTDLLRLAVADLENKGSDLKQFDLDENGYIDDVCLIYSAPRTGRDKGAYDSLSNEQKAELWALSFYDYNQSKNVDAPKANNFLWASADFMYEGISAGVDAHTYIHEMGHQFGLMDYYNVDADNPSFSDPSYKHYAPMGGLDMMDCNVQDHCMWSKLALGWVKPQVIDKDVELPLTIEIDDVVTGGNILLLAPRAKGYNGNAFDEYVTVELFSPEGLNAHDGAYSSVYPKGFAIPGIKIMHVDGRIYERDRLAFHHVVEDPTAIDYSSFSRMNFHAVGASNTPSLSINKDFRLIHLMESNANNTFRNADYQDSVGGHLAHNGTLFQGEEGRDVFDLERFSDFFTKDKEHNPVMNSGLEFGYRIKVNGIKKEGEGYRASLTIEEVGQENG